MELLFELNYRRMMDTISSILSRFQYNSLRQYILVLLICLGFVMSPIMQGTEREDSITPVKRIDNLYRFQPKELILPLSLITAGVVGVYNKPFHKLNHTINDAMKNMRGDRYFKADDYLQYLPVAAYLGLGAIGVKSNSSFRERLAAGVTAYIVMAVITNAGKYTFREKRPDSSGRHSFPSGHTATAFTGAELMRIEYGTGIGIAAYTFATGIAFCRLYNNRHWLNDVIAGAGVGIISARIGYWMLPLYQKWFKWGKESTDPIVAAAPSYNPKLRTLSFNLALSF